MTDLTIRTLGGDDLAAAAKVLADAFLTDDVDGVAVREAMVVEPGRGHGVFDGDQLIGTGQILTRRIVLPGTGFTPVAAVTSVSVAPGHRRRGALSMVMRAQLTGLHESGGEALAALWASEAAIYGRFGYGMATEVSMLTMPSKIPFRRGVDIGDQRVLEPSREKAIPLVRKLYERAATDRVGALDRGDGHWDYLLHDTERDRRGSSAYRFALHPDGYAIFRVRPEWREEGSRAELSVSELTTTTPQAYKALLRYLLDLDLVGSVRLRGSAQEPVTHLLHDPRLLRRGMTDGLWVRLVDVARALPLRAYSAPADVVIEIADRFCPWNEGRWQLKAGADGIASVDRTDAAADLAMGVDDLGAIFLGGIRPHTLALAGRISEHTPGALGALSRAFQSDSVPVCTEVF